MSNDLRPIDRFTECERCDGVCGGTERFCDRCVREKMRDVLEQWRQKHETVRKDTYDGHQVLQDCIQDVAEVVE